MRRRSLLMAILPLVLALLVPVDALAQQPKRGGVLRIAEREAPSLDPHLSISFLTHSYVSLTYSQLVRFPNGPEQKSPTDFSILPEPGTPGDLFYLTGFKGGTGTYTVTRPDSDLGMTVTWDATTLPYLWYWQQFGRIDGYPWYGRAWNVAADQQPESE